MRALIFRNKKFFMGAPRPLRQIIRGARVNATNNIKKIIMSNIRESSYAYCALADIRFFNGSEVLPDPSSIIPTGYLTGTCNLFDISVSSRWNNAGAYHITNCIIPNNRRASGEPNVYNGYTYWLSDTSISEITITFKENISLTHISVMSLATSYPNYRGTDLPFDTTLYDENNNIIKTVTVTPPPKPEDGKVPAHTVVSFV